MSKGPGYVSLDSLIHSAAWVRREREHRELQAEARRVYRKVMRSTGGCVCQNGCKCCECDDARAHLASDHHNAPDYSKNWTDYSFKYTEEDD